MALKFQLFLIEMNSTEFFSSWMLSPPQYSRLDVCTFHLIIKTGIYSVMFASDAVCLAYSDKVLVDSLLITLMNRNSNEKKKRIVKLFAVNV
jgi:hypothetical protein